MRYKKHKFKKKVSYNSFLDLIFFLILVLFLTFLNIKLFSFLKLSTDFAIFIFKIYFIFFILFLPFIISLYVFNKKFYYSLKVKDALNKIIKLNHFYETSLVNSTNLKGEDIKKNIVVYSPEIYYKVEKNYIFIKFRLDGSKYENSYIELEKNISNILKLKTMSELKLGEIEYKCLLKNIKPIICGSEIEGQVIKFVDSEKIYLTEDLAWNFRKHPHALITGVTGGGKTYLLYWIIRNLYSINSELKIIDPKMADLDYLKNFLDNSNVASSIGNIIRILRESSEIINLRNLEFQKRADYMQGKDYKDYGYKPIFVIFDEVTAFFASCDSKQSKEANGYLQEIIMKGRSAGVFVILTTQRADTDVISGKIRDQLSLRISMGQLSKDGYTMTFGSEYKDLNITMVGYVKDKPNTGVGYLYIDGVISKPQEFYSPVLNNGYNFFEDIKKLIINKKI